MSEAPQDFPVVIYHNPDCGTSRNALVNRPIVVTPRGVKLCRPSEVVFDLLDRKPAKFVKEDGEVLNLGSDHIP
jgi:hypothetical protein